MNEILIVRHLTKIFNSQVNKKNKIENANIKGALNDVSLTLEKGKVLSIIGPSGSGKSTLMRCCTQLETPTSGEIEICGIKLYQNKADDRKALLKTSLVFQNFNLFPHLSVLRNITEAQIKVLGRSREEAESIAEDLLKRMDLSDKKDTYPCFLSGGQQQRVSIARSLAMKPEIMFFDEPTSALDPELTREVLHIIKGLSDEKMTMVIVTHEMHFAHDVSDKVVFLENGSILLSGTSEEVLGSELADKRVKQFIASLEATNI